MRTGRFDEVFNDGEEREFLAETAEAALEEGRVTLTMHRQEPGLDLECLEDNVDNIERQKRKNKFLEDLRDAAEGV